MIEKEFLQEKEKIFSKTKREVTFFEVGDNKKRLNDNIKDKRKNATKKDDGYKFFDKINSYKDINKKRKDLLKKVGFKSNLKNKTTKVIGSIDRLNRSINNINREKSADENLRASRNILTKGTKKGFSIFSKIFRKNLSLAKIFKIATVKSAIIYQVAFIFSLIFISTMCFDEFMNFTSADTNTTVSVDGSYEGKAFPPYNPGIKNAPGEQYGAWGHCTWYVYRRRAQIGKPIDYPMGNGGDFYISAKTIGLKVDTEVKPGALICYPPYHPLIVTPSLKQYGHIAFIEEVYPDGNFLISEMNAGDGVLRFRRSSSIDKSGVYIIH